MSYVDILENALNYYFSLNGKMDNKNRIVDSGICKDTNGQTDILGV